MPIAVADLKFFQSERMTDESDGGGRMTAVEIAPGTENGVFDDLSDVDRAAGDVSIRKIYASVASDGPDKYLDAGVVIFRPPDDPSVSVLAFSTGDHYDERAALKNKLESGIARGSLYGGYLWGDHAPGQRAVTLWQRPTTELPSVGRRLEIAAFSGGVELRSQVLWITRVTDTILTRYDAEGSFQVRRVICELSEALTGNYTGSEPQKYDPTSSSMATRVYDTRYNAGALTVFGVQPLAASASVGDFSVRVADLYSPLIPTAFTETALPDVTPGGDSAALVLAGETAISFSTTVNAIGPSKSLYLGSGVFPGTLSITVSGSTITDQNGLLRLSGTEIGAISYSNGVCTFNSSCPNYGTASKSISFKPAAAPLRVADTAAQAVTVENRGFVWVITLAPIPAPGTLRVAYRVNNAWYVIADGGGGILSGADSSYGSGSLDFTTGTVVVTTGELPDVGSDILYAWATPVNYTPRGGDSVAAPVLRFQTANPSVLPGSVTAEWVQGVTTYTLTDSASDGSLTGTGGNGFIDYTTGEGWIQPTTVPAMGTEFNLDYDFGAPADLVTETISAPALNVEGNLEFTLADLPKPGTLKITVPTTVIGPIQAEGESAVKAEAIVPPPPPPANPVYYIAASLANSSCVATATSADYTEKSAADAAAAAINAAGTCTVAIAGAGAGVPFTVAGISMVARNPTPIFGGGCSISTWTISCSVWRR